MILYGGILNKETNIEKMNDESIGDILFDYYKIIRENQTKIPQVLAEVDKTIEIALNSNNKILKDRALSFISLKYDTLLQMDLNEKNIKNYYNDVKRFLQYNPDYNRKRPNTLTINKVLECISKIEYGCALLNIPSIAKKEFQYVLKTLMSDFDYYSNHDTSGDEEHRIYFITLVGYLIGYMTYYKEFLWDLYDFRKIMFYWKRNKFDHYEYDEQKKEEELKEDKYNFIWGD